MIIIINYLHFVNTFKNQPANTIYLERRLYHCYNRSMRRSKSANINIQKLKNILESDANTYGCKVHFDQILDEGIAGYHCEGHIYLSPIKDINDTISTFYHELAHEVCTLCHKYPLYHNKIKKSVDITSDEYINYAFEAELYVDFLAKRLMKRTFKNTRYHDSYEDTEECKKEFKKLFLQTNIGT